MKKVALVILTSVTLFAVPDMRAWSDDFKTPRSVFHHSASNWAAQQGYLGGIPNYESSPTGHAVICIKKDAAVLREMPRNTQGIPNVDINVMTTEQRTRLHRFTNRWAQQQGYVGGFPTYRASSKTYQVICIKKHAADLRECNRNSPGIPNVNLDVLNTAQRSMFHRFISRPATGVYVAGIPTYEATLESFGVIAIKQDAADIREVPRNFPGIPDVNLDVINEVN
jgi:hypothetical protein